MSVDGQTTSQRKIKLKLRPGTNIGNYEDDKE